MRLEKLRQLHLLAAPQPGRPLHLSAASGLVRVGSKLYVVADDELHLGAFSMLGGDAGTLLRILPGELPSTAEERKRRKPDFEALALLPPFPHYPQGALLALGSGSKKQRRRGVLLAVAGEAVNVASARVLDASGWFEQLGKEIDELNIEGAVVVEDRLLLMHRGNKSHAESCLISFGLATVLDAIADDDTLGKIPMLALQKYDLGAIDEVPLCFTDGAALPDGRLVFAAVAEDTADSYYDGPCHGAAVGVIGADGRVQAVSYLDPIYKIEGIHAELTASSIELWLVTDADDASTPALLMRGALPR